MCRVEPQIRLMKSADKLIHYWSSDAAGLTLVTQRRREVRKAIKTTRFCPRETLSIFALEPACDDGTLSCDYFIRGAMLLKTR